MAPLQESAKCANPLCPTAPDANPTLLRCSRCQVAQFCSRDCQTASWPDHKKECRRPNYIIEFHLHPEQITDPPVKRTLSCPSDASFEDLHMAIQAAFDWAATHTYDFAVQDPDYDPTAFDPLEMMLNRTMNMSRPGGNNMNPESSPREYVVRIKPREHYIGFQHDLMHEGQRRHPRTAEKTAEKFKLWQLFDNEEWKDLKLVYVYDFGDNWEHYMKVVGREPPSKEPPREGGHFRCLSGEGHAVAEDVGSWRGWNKLKDAYKAAKPTKEQREKMEWYENECSNNDEEGLRGDRVNFVDLAIINRTLGRVLSVEQYRPDFLR